MNRIVVKIIILALIFNSNMLSGQSRKLTLEDCLTIAEKHNPELIQLKLETEYSDARKSELAASYYPQINIYQGITKRNEAQYSRMKVDQGQDVIINSGQDNIKNSQFELNQMVFDFGETSHAIKAENFRKLAQLEQKENRRMEIRAAIKQQFYVSLINAKIDSLYAENVKRCDILKQMAIKRVEAGASVNTDILRAEVNLQNAIALHIAANNDWQKSLIELVPLLGIEQSDIMTSGTLPQISDQADIYNWAENAVERALLNRHDLRQIHLVKKQQDELTLSTKSSRWGKLFIDGNLTYSAPNLENEYWNDSDLGLKTYNGTISLRFSIPVFDGWRIKSQINQSTIRSSIISERIRELELQIEKQVRVELMNIRNMWTIMESARSAQKSAGENFNQIKINYENGAASSLELTDALNAVSAAEVQLVRSQFNILQSVITLERIIGSEFKFQ